MELQKVLEILEMNPSSVDSLAKIFSHSVGCLFVLFRVFFTVQKLLSLIRSHLFIFVFIVITLRGGSEKMLLSFMSESVGAFNLSQSPLRLSSFANMFSYSVGCLFVLFRVSFAVQKL